MLRGLWTLTWLELKIFIREPLGWFIGSVFMPVAVFVILGQALNIGRQVPTDLGSHALRRGRDGPVFGRDLRGC